MLQSMEKQRVGCDLATKQHITTSGPSSHLCFSLNPAILCPKYWRSLVGGGHPSAMSPALEDLPYYSQGLWSTSCCALLPPGQCLRSQPHAHQLHCQPSPTVTAGPQPLLYLRSDQISCSVVSDSLRPHESQHARPPCPSPTPGVHSDSRPLSQ